MRMYGSRNNFRRKKRKPVRVKFGRTVPVSASQSRTIGKMIQK